MSKKRIRVLYVSNTAGSMTPVADWLNNNGHKSRIVVREISDPWGLTSKSPVARMVNESESIFEVIRTEIERFRPTHIHVNSSLTGLAVARTASPYVPIVFHYHGSEVRGRRYAHLRVRLLSEKIVVSTPDLRMYGEWWGGPVGSQFTYRGGRRSGTAITILPPTINFNFQNQCKKFADMKGLDLRIIDCRKGESIPHDEMPELLSQYEYYLDFKGVRIPGALSLIAKEAYAVGCKVIHDSDLSKVVDDYVERTPEDYLNLYLSLKKPSVAIAPARLLYSVPRSYLLK